MSYVRDDDEHIERLRSGLAKYGIDTWIDKYDLQPGDFWKSVIRSVISSGEHFIACFSSAYNSRQSTYMNEELILAIEELRKRPTNSRWFIPVWLSGSIPDIDIGAGRTLQDIQRLDLRDVSEVIWDRRIVELAEAVKPGATTANPAATAEVTEKYIFERGDSGYHWPEYVSLDPDSDFGKIVMQRVAAIQTEARERLISQWPGLTLPAKKILRFFAEGELRSIDSEINSQGVAYEDMHDTFARLADVGKVPYGTFGPIRWLIWTSFDQDNVPEFRLRRVYQAPLREVLNIVDNDNDK